MNFTERFKSKNNKIFNFGANPFTGPATSRANVHSRKDSTPCSSINWGKNHQSVSDSSNVRSDNDESKIVLALSEGRGEARCEVGIAVINTSQPHLILCQISDTQGYDNTLRKINIFNPTQILVPQTFVESQSRLIEKVKEQFPDIVQIPVKRNTYNKVNGMENLKELCAPSLNSVLLVIQYRFYALTAAAALLKYLQNTLYIFYASGSIKIDYEESEGYAIIDISTADRLELVSSTRPTQAGKYSTLFDVLNNCYTAIGKRALRTILLQPPFAKNLILERQSCVEVLVRNPQTLQAIQCVLQKITNIGQLLSLPSIVVNNSDRYITRQLNYILLLNSLVDLLATLNEVVSDVRHPFFEQISETLLSPHFELIKKRVRTLLHENAYAAKNQNGLTQRCFAIKAGLNGLLDMVRKVYSERIDDMNEYVKLLGEKYNLPLTLGNNVTKGYHIVYKLNKHQKMAVKKTDLPNEFLQVQRLSGSFTMKTIELINFQSRIDEIVADILKISDTMIYKTLASFKQYMGLFFKLCEDVANLDVFQSLATISMRNNYVQPKINDFTEVIDSKHPILEMILNENPVANSIIANEDFNVHIITGPNGSGKSIYIRQLLLLQIMAQIGCFVPAVSATFRPADRMFARVYLEDNMECGASSFVLEMKEIIFILSHLTKNSLVIIDELGRSTSLEEGAALAMSICEKFVQTEAFVYLTSHFTSVSKLGDMYLNVKNWFMHADATGNNLRDMMLDFRYSLNEGVTNLRRYGIFIVRNIWPEDIMEDIFNMIENTSPKPPRNERVVAISEDVRANHQLRSDLKLLRLKGKYNTENVRKVVEKYRERLEEHGISFCSNELELNQNNECNELLQFSQNRVGNSSQISEPIQISLPSPNNTYYDAIPDLNFLNPDIHMSLPESDFQNESFNELKRKMGMGENSSTTAGLFENIETQNPKLNEEEVLNDALIEQSRFLAFSLDLNAKKVSTPIVSKVAEDYFSSSIILDNDSSIATSQLTQEDPVVGTRNVNIISNILIKPPTNLNDENGKETSKFKDLKDVESFGSCLSKLSNDPPHIFPNVVIVNKNLDCSTQSFEGVIQPRWARQENDKDHSADLFEECEEDIFETNKNPNEFNSPKNEKMFDSIFEGDADDFEIDLQVSYVKRGKTEGKNGENKTTTTMSTSEASRRRNLENCSSYSNESSGFEKKKANIPEANLNRNPDNNSFSISRDSLNESKSIENISKRTQKDCGKISKLKKKSNFNRFKFTKKQIQEEFAKQDSIFYDENVDSSTIEKYMKIRMNRPTVKQMQKAKCVAKVKRTEKGVIVEDNSTSLFGNPTRNYPKLKLHSSPANLFDVTIFSDQNSNRMDAFLASTEKNYNLFQFDEGKSQDSRVNFHSGFVRKRTFSMARSKSFDSSVFSRTNSFNHNSSNTSTFFSKRNFHD